MGDRVDLTHQWVTSAEVRRDGEKGHTGPPVLVVHWTDGARMGELRVNVHDLPVTMLSEGLALEAWRACHDDDDGEDRPACPPCEGEGTQDGRTDCTPCGGRGRLGTP